MISTRYLRSAAFAAAIAVAPLLCLPLHAASEREALLLELVFPPELVLDYAPDIGFTAEQQSRLYALASDLPYEAEALELELSLAFDALLETLSRPRVDEAEALARMEAVQRAELALKRLQLRAMVQIKNLLSEEQQAELRRLRDAEGW